jgi:uncharacterized protein (TIGR04168 family)
MHHQLRHTKQRLRVTLIASPEDTVYVNAASVPRIVHRGNVCLRNFTLVTLQNSLVSQVSLVWIDQDFNLHSEDVWYRSSGQPQAVLVEIACEGANI